MSIYIYIYIYIYMLNLFIYTYLIEHHRHFLSTYFLFILSICRIALMLFDWKWLINLP